MAGRLKKRPAFLKTAQNLLVETSKEPEEENVTATARLIWNGRARLSSARLSSARLSSARLSSARLSSARLSSALRKPSPGGTLSGFFQVGYPSVVRLRETMQIPPYA